MNNNIEKTLKEFDEKFPNYLEGELDFEELEWSKVPTPEAIKAFIIQALQNKEKEVVERIRGKVEGMKRNTLDEERLGNDIEKERQAFGDIYFNHALNDVLKILETKE